MKLLIDTNVILACYGIGSMDRVGWQHAEK